MTPLKSIAKASSLARSVFLNALPEDLLRRDVDRERVKELFRTYVDIVELENHSYCNRVCSFCPNAFIDRRSFNTVLDDAVYEKVLASLEEVGYRRSLTWAGYHEPTAHESIYGRLAEARRRLPNARLVLISNGDYLNEENIARLNEAGVDRMFVDLYPSCGSLLERGVEVELTRKFHERTGLSLSEAEEVENGKIYEVLDVPLRITVEVRFFGVDTMQTRGGLMDIPKRATYQRTASCIYPLRHLVVHFDGRGVLCCQTRSDTPEHAKAVIGDLNAEGYDLFDFYRDLGPARASLVRGGPKGGVCSSCDAMDYWPDRVGRLRGLGRVLSSVPGVEPLLRRAMRKHHESHSFE